MPAPAPTTPTAKPSQRIHCCENSNRVPQGRLMFLEADRALPGIKLVSAPQRVH